MALIAECTELRTKNKQRKQLLKECASPDQDPQPGKRPQWTNTAPMEATTATGSDTTSEMMSTTTAASAQWRIETNINIIKIIDRILDLESQGRFDLAVL